MKFTFALLLSAIFLVSCSSSPETEQTRSGNLTDVTHPTPENIPADDEVADVLVIGKHQNEKFSLIIDQLSNIEEYASIGNLDGKEEVIFGSIEDLGIDLRNRLYIINSLN